MIGYMLDDAAVGIYSAAIRLVEVWYFLPTAIGASVLPALGLWALVFLGQSFLEYRARPDTRMAPVAD